MALVEYVRTGAESPALGVTSRETPPTGDASAPAAKANREMAAALLGQGPPAKFRFTGYNKFLDPDGYPAIKPPWGTLNAIDLNTGRYLWTVPLGVYPKLAQKGLKDTGTEN